MKNSFPTLGSVTTGNRTTVISSRMSVLLVPYSLERGTTVKKLFIGAALALSATLVATPAMAAEDCVPTAAWTETVVDQAAVEPTEAVGEPTVTVPNPEYVPAVEEVSHLVEHPAETTTVNHPAETKIVVHEAEKHTEYHFAKYTQERTRTQVNGYWTEWSAYGAWTKYIPETHTSWELSTTPLNTPQFHSSGTRDKGATQWERLWQAQYDGQSREVEDKAAWEEVVVVKPASTETVVTKEAWTEKVVDVEAKEAIGDPTVTIPNPDYVAGTAGSAAVTHMVMHGATTCPVAASNTSPKTLAETGSDMTPLFAGIGISLALVAGGGYLMLRRRPAGNTEG